MLHRLCSSILLIHRGPNIFTATVRCGLRRNRNLNLIGLGGAIQQFSNVSVQETVKFTNDFKHHLMPLNKEEAFKILFRMKEEGMTVDLLAKMLVDQYTTNVAKYAPGYTVETSTEFINRLHELNIDVNTSVYCFQKILPFLLKDPMLSAELLLHNAKNYDVKYVIQGVFEHLAKSSQTRRAMRLFESLQQHQTVFPESTYNTMIGVYLAEKRSKMAFELIHHMKQHNIKLDGNQYVAIVEYYLSRPFEEEAAIRFIEEEEMPKESGVYNNITASMIAKKHMPIALKLFREMKDEGMKPSSKVVRSVLLHLVREGEADQVLGLLQDHREVYKFNDLFFACLEHCLQLGLKSRIVKLLNTTHKKEKTAVHDGYLDIIRYYCRRNDFSTGTKVYKEVMKEIPFQIEFYNEILVSYLNYNEGEALEFHNKMIEDGQEINMSTHLEIGNFLSLKNPQKATTYCENLEKTNGKLDIGLYNLLLRNYIQNKDIENASATLERMKELQVKRDKLSLQLSSRLNDLISRANKSQ